MSNATQPRTIAEVSAGLTPIEQAIHRHLQGPDRALPEADAAVIREAALRDVVRAEVATQGRRDAADAAAVDRIAGLDRRRHRIAAGEVEPPPRRPSPPALRAAVLARGTGPRRRRVDPAALRALRAAGKGGGR